MNLKYIPLRSGALIAIKLIIITKHVEGVKNNLQSTTAKIAYITMISITKKELSCAKTVS